METITEKTLDIEEILRSKMGKKARWVPRPLVSWLKHIAHEDFLNKFIWDARDLTGTPWLVDCLKYLEVKIEVEGLENLPDKNDGRNYTFVSNHPLGGIDGVAIGSVIGQHYDDRFRYLVNDLLMNLPGLAPLCIPINTTTKKSRSFTQIVEEGFKLIDKNLPNSKANDKGRPNEMHPAKTFTFSQAPPSKSVFAI